MNNYRATILITLLLAPSVALAEIGTVRHTEGVAWLVGSDGQSRSIKDGTEIEDGDNLITQENTIVQARMIDESLLTITSNTKMRFDQYSYSKENGGISFLSIAKGGFRSLTGFIGQLNKKNYRIITPHATIGIRGTDHETIVIPDGVDGTQAGTYNNVYSGATVISTRFGEIFNQPGERMAYAGGMHLPPQLLKIDARIFPAAHPLTRNPAGLNPKEGEKPKKQEINEEKSKDPKQKDNHASKESPLYKGDFSVDDEGMGEKASSIKKVPAIVVTGGFRPEALGGNEKGFTPNIAEQNPTKWGKWTDAPITSAAIKNIQPIGLNQPLQNIKPLYQDTKPFIPHAVMMPPVFKQPELPPVFKPMPGLNTPSGMSVLPGVKTVTP